MRHLTLYCNYQCTLNLSLYLKKNLAVDWKTNLSLGWKMTNLTQNLIVAASNLLADWKLKRTIDWKRLSSLRSLRALPSYFSELFLDGKRKAVAG